MRWLTVRPYVCCMATETILVVTSDLSGNGDANTVEFGFDGVGYEIDLTAAELGEFQAALQPYLDSARRRTTQPRKSRNSRRSGNPSTTKEERAKIREWGAKNGYDVPARGRIGKNIIEAFRAAQ